MTTFLYNLILTTGADRIARTDPNGWTLTVISVSVVFLALFVLYGVYSLSGHLFSGELKKYAKSKVTSSKTTSTSALSGNEKEETAAAIALALYLYLGTGSHDEESGVITIAGNEKRWGDRTLVFRRKPND